jgi:hypothetical protein
MATTNILVETFPGISDKRTIAFSLPSNSTTSDLLNRISSYLPENLPAKARLIVTTTSNKQILHSSTTTLANLTHQHNDAVSGISRHEPPAILPLRLSLPLCGGKGGFGSQLRAAGGRMSSRKKRNAAEPANSSSRNLDGRRLRTVAEAKSLAAYLATKPEMDRREKEKRRKRWEGVVEMAEVRAQEIREGRGVGRGKGVSDEWMADKEEVAEGVKSAVRMAMMAQGKGDEEEEMGKGAEDRETGESSGSAASGGGRSEDDSEEDVMELDDEDMERLKAEAEAGDVDAIFVLKNQVVHKPAKKPRRFAGFDSDEDEFLSSSSEDEKKEGRGGKEKGKEKQKEKAKVDA